MSDFPRDLLGLTRTLIGLRQKPTTQARYKAYPEMLKLFGELVETCDDPDLLRQVIALDDGYYLLAGYRQRTLERLLALDRSPDVLRMYAMQLELFGDVDEFGEADLEHVDERVAELEAEADRLENQ